MKRVFLVARTGLAERDLDFIERQPDLTRVGRPDDAEVILVLGGDGAMLKAIRAHRGHGRPFIGLNRGHIGFLMNDWTDTTLREILSGQVEHTPVRLLSATLFGPGGERLGTELAFNDFYFERASPQTAKIDVTVNGKLRFEPLTCDGVLVCTSAGSTAYNASAGGVILPIGVDGLVLTGICPALFHRWRSSQLSADARILLHPVQTGDRPVRFLTDGIEIPGVARAEIGYSDAFVQLGFARSQNFREKVLSLQFVTV